MVSINFSLFLGFNNHIRVAYYYQYMVLEVHWNDKMLLSTKLSQPNNQWLFYCITIKRMLNSLMFEKVWCINCMSTISCLCGGDSCVVKCQV